MGGSKQLLIFLFTGLLMACAVPHYQDPVVTEKALDANALCFANTPLCMHFQWETQPTDTAMGSYQLSFFAPSAPDTPVDPSLKMAIVLWMPSMGHGSSPVTIEHLAPGLYRASRVFFIMPGQWQIRTQLKDGEDHVVDQITQTISI